MTNLDEALDSGNNGPHHIVSLVRIRLATLPYNKASKIARYADRHTQVLGVSTFLKNSSVFSRRSAAIFSGGPFFMGLTSGGRCEWQTDDVLLYHP
jgi:hypothetical protein